MMPGLVFVWQPAALCYGVFLTGGLTDANRWIHGTHDGVRSFTTLLDIGAPVREVAKGVYALEVSW